MKRLLLLFALLSLLLIFLQATRAAPEAPFDLPWWTADTGGGSATGGTYTLSGTTGQADPGTLRGGDYAVSGGFWAAFLEAWREIFLPYLTR